MNVKKELASSVRFCAWGFVLILFNINIGVFDILPDWLGFIFLLVGVNRIAQHREEAKHLRVFALILLVNNVFAFVEKIFADELYGGFLVLTVLIYVISLYFYFAFFTCAANIAEEYAPERKSSIIACRNVYALLYCFNTLLMLFGGAGVLGVLSLIANLVALIGVCICLFSLAADMSIEESDMEE